MHSRTHLAGPVALIAEVSSALADRVAAGLSEERLRIIRSSPNLRSPTDVVASRVLVEDTDAPDTRRSLQDAAGRSPAAGPGVAKRIRSVFQVFTLALVSIAATGLAARPAVCAAEEAGAAASKPLKIVVLPAQAHVLAKGFASAEESLEWSADANTNLEAAVREIIGTRADLAVRGMPNVSADERRVIDEFVSVASLSGVALTEAGLSTYANVHRSVLDRNFGASLAFLHDRADADYALGTFACQQEQTKRVASVGATVGLSILTGGNVYGFLPITNSYVTLFLADLRTGELRWFEVDIGHEVSGYNFTDLRDPESARKVVASLLRQNANGAKPQREPVATGPSSMRRVSALEGEFNIQIPADWRARNNVKRVVRASRDGNALNEMSLELRSHGRAFPNSEQKITRESAPEQVAALFVEDLQKQDLDALEIIDITEDTLADRPAFRVRYSYQMRGCLKAVRVEQVTVGTVIPKGLLLAGLRAPQLLFFEEALPVFEQSVRTVAVKP